MLGETARSKTRHDARDLNLERSDIGDKEKAKIDVSVGSERGIGLDMPGIGHNERGLRPRFAHSFDTLDTRLC
jgi:hypothetical protein